MDEILKDNQQRKPYIINVIDFFGKILCQRRFSLNKGKIL